jgi:uncharacterized membrane protein YfcA
MDIEQLILLITAFVASIISGMAGFGGSTLLTPILTISQGVEIAVPMLTICMFFSNIARVFVGWKQISWKSVGLFLISAVPLSALGAFGFTILPKYIVTRVIGVALLIFIILKIFKFKEFKANNKILIIGGSVVGLLSGLVGSAGPIGAAIFVSLGLPPIGYIASEATAASVLHIVKILIYGSLLNIPVEIWLQGIIMGLVMVLGTFIAKHYVQKMAYVKFQNMIAVLLGIVAVYMIIFG